MLNMESLSLLRLTSASVLLQIYVMSVGAVLAQRSVEVACDWLLPACVPKGGSLKSRSPVKYEIPVRRSV